MTCNEGGFPKPIVTSNGIYLLGADLTYGETLCFRDLEFITDLFNN
jgi:hypothetical protein